MLTTNVCAQCPRYHSVNRFRERPGDSGSGPDVGTDAALVVDLLSRGIVLHEKGYKLNNVRVLSRRSVDHCEHTASAMNMRTSELNSLSVPSRATIRVRPVTVFGFGIQFLGLDSQAPVGPTVGTGEGPLHWYAGTSQTVLLALGGQPS
jgi:hypothetical protein